MVQEARCTCCPSLGCSHSPFALDTCVQPLTSIDRFSALPQASEELHVCLEVRDRLHLRMKDPNCKSLLRAPLRASSPGM